MVAASLLPGPFEVTSDKANSVGTQTFDSDLRKLELLFHKQQFHFLLRSLILQRHLRNLEFNLEELYDTLSLGNYRNCMGPNVGIQYPRTRSFVSATNDGTLRRGIEGNFTEFADSHVNDTPDNALVQEYPTTPVKSIAVASTEGGDNLPRLVKYHISGWEFNHSSCWRCIGHPPWNHGLLAWLAFMSVLIL